VSKQCRRPQPEKPARVLLVVGKVHAADQGHDSAGNTPQHTQDAEHQSQGQPLIGFYNLIFPGQEHFSLSRHALIEDHGEYSGLVITWPGCWVVPQPSPCCWLA
jgi:hypothetical protein